jgi:hypothetical protein
MFYANFTATKASERITTHEQEILRGAQQEATGSTLETANSELRRIPSASLHNSKTIVERKRPKAKVLKF